MAQYRPIFTRSPFFVQKSSTDLIVNCEIRLWTGALAAKPFDYTYLLSKEVFDSKATFEISELLRDYINHTSATSNGAVFVEVTLEDTTNSVVETYMALEGYNTYLEASQTNLQTPDYYKVLLPNTNGFMEVLVGEGMDNNIPVIFNNSGNLEDDFSYETFNGATSNGVVQVAAPTSTTDFITNIPVTNLITKVDITINSIDYPVFVKKVDCSKFDKLSLMYVNKGGAKSYMPFDLKHIEKLNLSSKSFGRSLMNYGTLSNNSTLHSSRKMLGNIKQSFELNTNWLDEYYVQHIEELMLSEYVWLIGYGDNAIPVNITDSNFIKKNHLNDKLFNYTVSVEASNNYINTIR